MSPRQPPSQNEQGRRVEEREAPMIDRGALWNGLLLRISVGPRGVESRTRDRWSGRLQMVTQKAAPTIVSVSLSELAAGEAEVGTPPRHTRQQAGGHHGIRTGLSCPLSGVNGAVAIAATSARSAMLTRLLGSALCM
jgi:hypothetical protein